MCDLLYDFLHWLVHKLKYFNVMVIADVFMMCDMNMLKTDLLWLVTVNVMFNMCEATWHMYCNVNVLLDVLATCDLNVSDLLWLMTVNVFFMTKIVNFTQVIMTTGYVCLPACPAPRINEKQ